MSQEQNSWTLDNNSQASNPGKLRVNVLHWYSNYPLWPTIWLVPFVLSLGLAVVVHAVFWVPTILLGAMNWLYWQRVREHFRCGCALPGVVVSVDPMLIAVYTDLTMGHGSYPAIKIIEKSLATINGVEPKPGITLPLVALYHQNPTHDIPHWANFDPRPVQCATKNVSQIKRILSTFDSDDWAEFRRDLAQVPRPYEPGLYMIRPAI